MISAILMWPEKEQCVLIGSSILHWPVRYIEQCWTASHSDSDHMEKTDCQYIITLVGRRPNICMLVTAQVQCPVFCHYNSLDVWI